jgi:hypothetical protein
VSGEGVIFSHEDVGTGLAAVFGFVVKTGVGMSAEYHVAGTVCGAVVGVGGKEVEKLVDCFGGGLGGSGLLGAQCAESSKELLVNCACIVEEGTDDALDSLDACFGEWRTVGFIVGELGELSVDNFVMLVRRELALGRHGMIVFDADVADVARHGEVT